MNATTNVNEKDLLRANLLGFAMLCKSAGKTDADIPALVKRAQAHQEVTMRKRAKISELILGNLAAQAATAATAATAAA